MKFIFTVILFAWAFTPCLAQNENCNLRIVDDKLANVKTAFTQAIMIENSTNKIDLNFWRTGKFIVFSALISGNDLYCFDNASTAAIQFTDHTVVTLTATNTSNCTGSFQSFLTNISSQAEIDALSAKAIISIIIKGKNLNSSFKISSMQAMQLKSYFNCLKKADL